VIVATLDGTVRGIVLETGSTEWELDLNASGGAARVVGAPLVVSRPNATLLVLAYELQGAVSNTPTVRAWRLPAR
jgi:hypothetical protein